MKLSKRIPRLNKRDIQIRKLRRSQERIKTNKEREIIRLHKYKKNAELLKLDDTGK